MSDLLSQISDIRTKKGKKARKQAAKERSNEQQNEQEEQETKRSKPKVVVLQDLEELAQKSRSLNLQAVSRKEKVDDDDNDNAEGQNKAKGVQNAIIIAGVNMRLEESDVRRIFQEFAVAKLTVEAGYFIVEFTSEEDVQKAVKKSRQQYRQGVILVDKYSIEDENPEEQMRNQRRNTGFIRESQYDTPYKTQLPQSAFQFGVKKQQAPPPGGMPRDSSFDRGSYSSGDRGYSYGHRNYEQPTPAFRIGGKAQQPPPMVRTPYPKPQPEPEPKEPGQMTWLEKRRLEKAAQEAQAQLNK